MNKAASIVVLFLMCLVYLPGTNLGWITIHFEDALILVAAVIAFIANSDSFRKTERKNLPLWIVLYALGVGWLWIVTLTESILSGEFDITSISKLFSMLRPFAFAMVCVTALRREGGGRAVLASFAIIGILQVMILFCQKYNLFEVNAWLTPRYALVIENSIYSLMGLRTDGTYGNPNDVAVALVPFGAVSYSACLLLGGRPFIRVLCGIAALVILYTVTFYCRSRTGTAGVLGSYAAVHLSCLILRRRMGSNMLVGIAIIGLMSYLFWSSADTAFMDRFAVFLGRERLTEEASFSERTEMWKNALDGLGLLILTGKGFKPFIDIGFLDGGYASYLLVGGGVSLFLIGGMYICLAVSLLYKEMVRTGENSFTYLSVAGIAVCFGGLIITVSHPVIFNDRIWILHFLVMLMASRGLAVNQKFVPVKAGLPVNGEQRACELRSRLASSHSC